MRTRVAGPRAGLLTFQVAVFKEGSDGEVAIGADELDCLSFLDNTESRW